jgi:hypothetical protein
MANLMFGCCWASQTTLRLSGSDSSPVPDADARFAKGAIGQ